MQPFDVLHREGLHPTGYRGADVGGSPCGRFLHVFSIREPQPVHRAAGLDFWIWNVAARHRFMTWDKAVSGMYFRQCLWTPAASVCVIRPVGKAWQAPSQASSGPGISLSSGHRGSGREWARCSWCALSPCGSLLVSGARLPCESGAVYVMFPAAEMLCHADIDFAGGCVSRREAQELRASLPFAVAALPGTPAHAWPASTRFMSRAARSKSLVRPLCG